SATVTNRAQRLRHISCTTAAAVNAIRSDLTIGRLIGPLLSLVIVALTTCQAHATAASEEIITSSFVPSITAERSESTFHSSLKSQYTTSAFETTDPGNVVRASLPLTVEPIAGVDGASLFVHGTVSPYSGGGLYNFPTGSVPEPQNVCASGNTLF